MSKPPDLKPWLHDAYQVQASVGSKVTLTRGVNSEKLREFV